jgi:hypothetical protein
MAKEVPAKKPDSSRTVGGNKPVRKRRSAARRHKHGRSRLTNHQDLLPALDGRSSAARRFRDLVGAYIADMGGLDLCSEVKLGLLRRLAACTVRAEMLEAELLNGGQVSVSELCALASTAVRLSSRLGLERCQKTVGPTLAEYLESLQAKAEPEVEAEGAEVNEDGEDA